MPVTTEEAARIEQRAASAGLSVAAYLRQVGQGYEPRAHLDHQRVEALTQAMGNLGRLGGLLKLWLTDDPKLNAYPSAQVRRVIPEVLARIRDNQAALLKVIQQLRTGP